MGVLVNDVILTNELLKPVKVKNELNEVVVPGKLVTEVNRPVEEKPVEVNRPVEEPVEEKDPVAEPEDTAVPVSVCATGHSGAFASP